MTTTTLEEITEVIEDIDSEKGATQEQIFRHFERKKDVPNSEKHVLQSNIVRILKQAIVDGFIEKFEDFYRVSSKSKCNFPVKKNPLPSGENEISESHHQDDNNVSLNSDYDEIYCHDEEACDNGDNSIQNNKNSQIDDETTDMCQCQINTPRTSKQFKLFNCQHIHPSLQEYLCDDRSKHIDECVERLLQTIRDYDKPSYNCFKLQKESKRMKMTPKRQTTSRKQRKTARRKNMENDTRSRKRIKLDGRRRRCCVRSKRLSSQSSDTESVSDSKNSENEDGEKDRKEKRSNSSDSGNLSDSSTKSVLNANQNDTGKSNSNDENGRETSLRLGEKNSRNYYHKYRGGGGHGRRQEYRYSKKNNTKRKRDVDDDDDEYDGNMVRHRIFGKTNTGNDINSKKQEYPNDPYGDDRNRARKRIRGDPEPGPSGQDRRRGGNTSPPPPSFDPDAIPGKSGLESKESNHSNSSDPPRYRTKVIDKTECADLHKNEDDDKDQDDEKDE